MITALDPQLVRGEDGVWRPGQGSPVAGKAQAYPYVAVPSVPGVDGSTFSPDVDIDGRPRGGRKDIGCHQISEHPGLRRPLTKQDVGPEWMREQ